MTAKMVSNRHTPSRDKDYCLPRKDTAARLRYQSPVQRQVEGDQGGSSEPDTPSIPPGSCRPGLNAKREVVRIQLSETGARVAAPGQS